MTFARKVTHGCAAGLAALLVPAAHAQDTSAHALPAVVVTRDRARSPMDLAFGISVVRPDSAAPGQTHTQADQTLAYIPGVTTANRTNPSQDPRVSVRGFGARSTFGVRSVRILRDGMPLTLPDGQTPLDYLDLESVGRVEAIRGSAAALYGNASGGVIDLRSVAPPSGPFQAQARSWYGENDAQRYALLLGGTSARASYTGNVGATTSDGVRAHARQRLANAFVHSGTTIGGTDVSVIAMALDMPLAENPGALTRAQLDSAPDMADPASVAKNARKVVRQAQVGVDLRHSLRGTGEVSALVYGGGRHLFNPLTFAVVGVERGSGGGSLRATIPAGARPNGAQNWITIGIDAQAMNDARRNWANCNGVTAATANCPTPGLEQGVLSVDQRERVNSVGPYARDEFAVGRLRLTGGLRADRTAYRLRDFYLQDGDDSGARTMSAVSPMAGVAVRLRPAQTWYANVASAFETPTTTELTNKPDSSAGLSPTLRPQQSNTVETGVRGDAARVHYDVALYSTSVRDELIPFDIGSGRQAFRNAGRTHRRGAELGLEGSMGPVTLTGAYTYSHFRFAQFVVAGVDQSGHAIPGVPEHQGQLAATWRERYGMAVLEWQAKSRVFVNDVNTAAAPAYAIMNVRVVGTPSHARPWLTPVVGVQNVFDRTYAASVAINAAGTAASGKFYEPGAGRTWFIGLSAATTPW